MKQNSSVWKKLWRRRKEGMVSGTDCWPAVVMQSSFWGPLAPAMSQTDLWCELSCLFWFCHTLLTIYCWKNFVVSIELSDPQVKTVMEIFKKISDLEGRAVPPGWVLNTNYLPSDFSLSQTSSWHLLLLLALFLLSVSEALSFPGFSERGSHPTVAVGALSRAQTVP